MTGMIIRLCTVMRIKTQFRLITIQTRLLCEVFVYQERPHLLLLSPGSRRKEREPGRLESLIISPSSLSCPPLLSSHSSFFKLRKFRPPGPSSCSVAGQGWLFYKCFREVARMSLEAWDPTQPGCSLVSWWIKLIDYQSINQPEQAQCILDPASRGVRTHPVYLESSYEQSIRISTSRQNYKHSSGILSQLLRTNQPHTWEKYQEFFRN